MLSMLIITGVYEKWLGHEDSIFIMGLSTEKVVFSFAFSAFLSWEGTVFLPAGGNNIQGAILGTRTSSSPEIKLVDPLTIDS